MASYLVDRVGRVAGWTVEAERLKGYSADEIVGRPLSMFYPAPERSDGLAEEHLVAAVAGILDQESWRVRKDGSRFRASTRTIPIRGEDRHVVGFIRLTRAVREGAGRSEGVETDLDETIRRLRVQLASLHQVLGGADGQDPRKLRAQLAVIDYRLASLARTLGHTIDIRRRPP